MPTYAFPSGLVVDDLRQTLPRHASKVYARRTLRQVKGLCVHNSGPPAHKDHASAFLADYHVNDNDWPAIAYNFVVHWDGAIDYTLDWQECGWHAGGQNNIDYLAICLTGWWDGRTPSEAQLTATRELVAALQHAFGTWFPVVGHKQIYASACPGDTWEQWRERVTVKPPEATPAPDLAARVAALEATLGERDAEIARQRAKLQQIAALAGSSA